MDTSGGSNANTDNAFSCSVLTMHGTRWSEISWWPYGMSGRLYSSAVSYFMKTRNSSCNDDVLHSNQVSLLTTCMTTPDDSSCTIKSVTTSLPLMVCWRSFITCFGFSLPFTCVRSLCFYIMQYHAMPYNTWQYNNMTGKLDDDYCRTTAAISIIAFLIFLLSKVTNMDSCMTSIEDGSCTSSYGATSKYVSKGGSSLVGWVQQLSEWKKIFGLISITPFIWIVRNALDHPMHAWHDSSYFLNGGDRWRRRK